MSRSRNVNPNSSAILATLGPRLVLHSGPVRSGFMRVSAVLDFVGWPSEQPSIERPVHLRLQDFVRLADSIEQHVAELRAAHTVESREEFMNLDVQLRLGLLDGSVEGDIATFGIRCLFDIGRPAGGGPRTWLGVEAQVEAPAAEQFVNELRVLAQNFPGRGQRET